MQHEEAPELLPAYALEAVTEPERVLVAAHLRQCAACRRDLAGLWDVVTVLPLVLEPVTPPSDLRRRLLEAAMGSRSLTRRDNPGPVLRRLARQYSKGWLAAAALFVAALGLGGWGLVEHGQLRATASNALVATPGAVGANGTVGRLAGRFPAVAVTGLAVPPHAEVYEAWVIHSGVPLAAGLFVTSVEGTGGVVLTTRPLPGDQLVITLEPAPGDKTPTGPALLVGTVTA